MLKLKEFILGNEDWKTLLKEKPFALDWVEDEKYILFRYNMIDSDPTNDIVKEARGIIFRKSDWKAVCVPFFRFYNQVESYSDKLDWSTTSIQEKVDGCLDAETKLETEDGAKTIKEICDIKYSGKVLAFNFIDNKIVFTEIIGHSVEENNNDWYELEVEDGKKIKFTGNHKVWLENLNCYRCVRDLKEGDEVKII